MGASPQDQGEPTMNGAHHLNAPGKSSASALQILALLFALAIGCLIGVYATSSLIESEYQSIASQLRSNYKLSLSETKEEHKICQEELAKQKKSYLQVVATNGDDCTEELKLLESRWKYAELSCQQEVEGEMVWSHKAFEDSTSALARVSQKLQSMRGEVTSTKIELEEKHAELEQVTSDLESTRMQHNEAQRKLEQILSQRDETIAQLNQTQSLVSTLEKEMELRDLERAKCDQTHRDLNQCKKNLQKTVEGSTDGCTTSLDLLQNDKADLSHQLEALKSHNDKIVEESEFMKRRLDHVEKQLESANELVKVFEMERDGLKVEVENMIKKIQEKDRLDVLHRYGPGPHQIEFIIQLPTNPPSEEAILLELAPLDLMPHTIKSFLDMVESGTLVDGTFMIGKSHITLVGPVDYHDAENNHRLEERLKSVGILDGLLLLIEYTSDYPHNEGTVGFTAGYFGPVFYVNMADNTELHGQNNDPCFGRFVTGFDLVEKINRMSKREEDGVFDLPIYIVRAEVV